MVSTFIKSVLILKEASLSRYFGKFAVGISIDFNILLFYYIDYHKS